MTAVTRFFFRSPTASPGTWSVVQWWESRRVAYNIAVGVAGVASLAALALSAALPPHPYHLQGPPLFGVVLYAVLANACYCLGPAIDIIVLRRWGAGYSAVGPALFRYGFAFAIGLTLLPIPVAVLSWGVRLVASLA